MLKEEEEKERKVMETKKEKAERRKGYWQDWREESRKIENENTHRRVKEDTNKDDEMKERKRFVMEMKTKRKRWEEDKEAAPSLHTEQASPDPPPEIISHRYPDDSSHIHESTVKGLPPVQEVPPVKQLHEGHLGEVTLGVGQWPHQPPPLQPTPSPARREDCLGGRARRRDYA